MSGNRKIIKVENPANYWTNFGYDADVFYRFCWDGADSTNLFEVNELEILKHLAAIGRKYQLIVPIQEPENKGSFVQMYTINGDYCFPSYLFTDVQAIEPEAIVSIFPRVLLKDYKPNYSTSDPIAVRLYNFPNLWSISLRIVSDVFNDTLTEWPKRYEFNFDGDSIDNAELAVLNTSRLNSFLRDLKQVCIQFGANDFYVENSGMENYTEKGVEIMGEVLYYEDIEDLLPYYQRL